MFKFFLIFFLLSSAHAGAQVARLDSLNWELNRLDPKAADYTDKKIKMLDLAVEIRTSSGMVEGTDLLIDSLAALLLAKGDSVGYYAAIYLDKANLQARAIEYLDEALINYQKYVFYLKQLQKESDNPYIFIDIGNVYYRLSLHESAIRYYRMALNFFSQKNDYHGVITSYNNIALSKQKLDQADSSVLYCQKSLEISQQYTKDSFEIAHCYYILGQALTTAQKHDEALAIFERSLAILENNNLKLYKDFHHLGFVPMEICRAIGDLYLAKNEAATAQEWLAKAEEMNARYTPKDQRNQNSLLMLELKILLASKQFAEAERLVNNPQLNEQGSALFKKNIYNALYLAYLQDKQTDKIYEYGYKYLILEDSLVNQSFKQKTLSINNLVLQLENEQVIEQQNIQILNQQIERERQLTVSYGLLAALLIACLVCGIIIFFVVKLRRQNQLIQRYAADLERSNKDKELLLTVIGHDIRSPFQVVFKNIDAAYQYFNVAKESPILKHLSSAKKSAEQAFVMLDNLLQWVVIQQNNIQPKPEQVNISQILEDLVGQFKAMSLLESLEIKIESPLPIVQTDPAILLIIVRNLLLNAVKYSKINSQISIKAEYTAQKTILIIENQANEVSRALLHKINNPEQSTQKGVFKGGGLGLQLVQQLAQRLHIQTQIINPKEDWISTQIIFAQANQTHAETSPAPQRREDKNPYILVKIPKQQHETFNNWVQQLRTFEVFETSELQRLLKDNPFQQQKGAEAWLEMLQNAIEEVDDQLFSHITNQYQLLDEPIIL